MASELGQTPDSGKKLPQPEPHVISVQTCSHMLSLSPCMVASPN